MTLYALRSLPRPEGNVRWSFLQQLTREAYIISAFSRGPTPEFVVKIAAREETAASLRREAAILASIAHAADSLGAPRLILGPGSNPAECLFVQSGVPGQPLPEEIDPEDRREIERQFTLVLPWLDRLSAALPCREKVASVLDRFAVSCRGGLQPRAPELSLLDSVPGKLGDVAAEPAHGDFWGGNVLESQGRLGVIDWGLFGPGVPLEDLFNFSSAIAFRPYRNDPVREAVAVRRAFFGSSFLASRTREAALSQLKRLRVDNGLTQALFEGFLLSRLSKGEFSNFGMWREFIRLYVEAGSPRVFSPAGAWGTAG